MLLSGLLVTKYLAEGMGEFPITNIPAARVGTPEDVAGTALYLASRAGAFVNGATITVDGGTSWRCLLDLDYTNTNLGMLVNMQSSKL